MLLADDDKGGRAETTLTLPLRLFLLFPRFPHLRNRSFFPAPIHSAQAAAIARPNPRAPDQGAVGFCFLFFGCDAPAFQLLHSNAVSHQQASFTPTSARRLASDTNRALSAAGLHNSRLESSTGQNCKRDPSLSLNSQALITIGQSAQSEFQAHRRFQGGGVMGKTGESATHDKFQSLPSFPGRETEVSCISSEVISIDRTRLH